MWMEVVENGILRQDFARLVLFSRFTPQNEDILNLLRGVNKFLACN
jgi:hypothetical protein